MIRFRRLSIELLNAWLVNLGVTNDHPRYRLRAWRENRAGLAAIHAELVAYINEAFEDARMRLRRGFEDPLTPFVNALDDPAANYPALLHHVTLQGYLGETLAAMAVEHWGAIGHDDWVVPAFLFRFHEQEFQHLEAINQRIRDGEAYEPDETAEQRPGRTGDDGLAFRINNENVITDVLTLEAKCVSENRTEKIQDAHEKLAAGGALPSGIRELINILADYNTEEAQRWQQALLQFWRDGYRTATRHDGIGYICGSVPAQRRRVAWLPVNAPHPAYNVDRNLEAIEVQFEDLPAVINTLYRGD